jgi:hypothetical protein
LFPVNAQVVSCDKRIIHKICKNMKKLSTLLFAAGMMVSVASLMFTGCTKEGPQGPAGPAGKDGTNGTNGQDANSNCVQCHNWGDTLVAKIFQYDASQHATGSTAFENRNTCAPCHTSQGFVEIAQTNADTTMYAVSDPAPINCRTCHKIHTTFSNTDWALRRTAPVTLRTTGETMDLPGTGNLCAECHQPRKASPWVDNPMSMDSLKVTSFRWGPHYGTQSVVLMGQGALEMGAAPYENSPHRMATGCTDCHGAAAVGNFTGGHTYWLANEEEGDNLAGCKVADCHPNATSFDIDGKQTEIEGLFMQLEEKLIAANVIDTTLHIIPNKYYTKKQLAVVWNFLLVEYDRSWGVHNYKYTRDMLQSGIDFMNTKGL